MPEPKDQNVDTVWANPVTPDELDRYYEFRWKWLREPLGKPRGSERDPLDDDAYHLYVRSGNDRIIACGRLHRVGAGLGQIRYMAVHEKYRGKGIGSGLLERLEHRARETGLDRITLNARDDARSFYQQRGYIVSGCGPVLYGVMTHTTMHRLLR